MGYSTWINLDIPDISMDECNEIGKRLLDTSKPTCLEYGTYQPVIRILSDSISVRDTVTMRASIPITPEGIACEYEKGDAYFSGEFNHFWNEDETVIKEMLELSADYPHLYFNIDANGEESEDIWKMFFHDGKGQYCQGRIVFDEQRDWNSIKKGAMDYAESNN